MKIHKNYIFPHIHVTECYPFGVSVYMINVVWVCVSFIREGIQWEAIDWMDNAECLDLIEKVRDSRKAALPPGTMANHQPECVDPGATLLTLTLLSQSIII